MPESFLKIAQAAPVGVFALSAEGQIRLANPALCHIFGYQPEALIGQSVDFLFPPASPDTPQTLQERLAAEPEQNALNGHAALFGRHADGRLIPIEIGLGSTGANDEALTVAFVTDISIRKSSEERFAAIIESLPVGLLMTDAAGSIVLTNPALDDMFGHESGTLAGKTLEILLPLRSRPGHPAMRQSYMRAPEKRTMGAGRDLMALHGSGKEFPVEVALTPIFHKEQHGALAIVTDISVRKKLEHELRQANAKLEEFTYIVSHDLRAPLRGIADLLEWIQEDFAPDSLQETTKNNFARAKLRIERVERMIEDLLVYARSSTRHSRTEMVNPHHLIMEILGLMQIPPSFQVTVEAPNLEFLTYKVPLQTGLMNMLDNAVKHRPTPGGRIDVTVREEGRYFIFSVDDDGEGIPDSAREKIFKLFHRASGKSDGHGIGLSVTKRMITSHGGELILEKHSKRGGACFAIYWPRFEVKDE
jgi:PAS domain S-box-containing protein